MTEEDMGHFMGEAKLMFVPIHSQYKAETEDVTTDCVENSPEFVMDICQSLTS